MSFNPNDGRFGGQRNTPGTTQATAQMKHTTIQAPIGNNGLPWQIGLCDCMDDCSTCCMGLWCPCVLYGKNHETLKNEPGCAGPAYSFCVLALFGCSCFVAAPTRRLLRSKYQLRDGRCGDHMLTLCCGPCALCQETREWEYRSGRNAPMTAPMTAPGTYNAPFQQPSIKKY